MEEELNLLKNEIKQNLLDLQEHVLNVQNPFSSAGGASGFVTGVPDREPTSVAASAGGSGQTPPTPQAPIRGNRRIRNIKHEAIVAATSIRKV